jgi:hypothetical protein
MNTSCGGCISTFVVDFDSTCTQHDTTSLYGQLAAEEADARQEWEKGAAIRKAWEEAGRMYAKQYHETMTQALPEVRIIRNINFPSLEIVIVPQSLCEVEGNFCAQSHLPNLLISYVDFVESALLCLSSLAMSISCAGTPVRGR